MRSKVNFTSTFSTLLSLPFVFLSLGVFLQQLLIARDPPLSKESDKVAFGGRQSKKSRCIISEF